MYSEGMYTLCIEMYTWKRKKRLENKKSVQSDRNSHIQKYIVLTVHKEDEWHKTVILLYSIKKGQVWLNSHKFLVFSQVICSY